MTVCQLAPCHTDDCPLTGRACTRPYPWRHTAAAILQQVNPTNDPTIYVPLPPEQREQPTGRRMRPYASADASITAAPHPTIPGL